MYLGFKKIKPKIKGKIGIAHLAISSKAWAGKRMNVFFKIIFKLSMGKYTYKNFVLFIFQGYGGGFDAIQT